MIVRTVLGDIDPAELGPCDAHEHLVLDTPAQPGEEFLEVDKAIEEAATLVVAGGRSLIDWTPFGLGRYLDGLEAVSRATGLHVVGATGLHRDAHYTADDPLRSTAVDELVARFVEELRGRCGIVKVGASYHHLTPVGGALQVGGETGGSARRDRRARVRAHPARDDGARDRRATRWARGSAKVGDPRPRRPQPRPG